MTFLVAAAAIQTAAATKTSLLAQPGAVAFLVVFGMAVLLYFVFRSMSKHLRKVNQMARDEEDKQQAMAAGRNDSSGSPGGR
ncbi:MAG TPA: hypothetical protein VFQ44_22770 [Streptosporangiaceae bacterium]|nr:hypothetical protein [Streptosporangiaceae bacterium]